MRMAVTAALLLAAFPTGLHAGEPGLWARVADARPAEFERLVRQAKEGLLKTNDLAGAEAGLRAALALDLGDRPGLFEAALLLAEVQAARGESSQAVQTLERAEPLARFAGQQADCWFRLGVERSKLGQYREALASYDRQLALGPAAGTVYANAAELLMALGRLGEAEARYRDAIRADEQSGDRRARDHALALSHYGLAVALDRDEQPAAAREMMGRALALDPNQSTLNLAHQPGSDVFLIPDGEASYYSGLAAEADGRADDAQSSFREFLARQPRSPWANRARAHLATPPGRAAGQGLARRLPPAARRRWRVLAMATISSNGPLPAPLIDAAWKERPPPIEECLAAASPPAGHGTVRALLELDIDARGLVERASVKLPPVVDDGVAGPCMEAAVKVGLSVAMPAHARPTSARIEVLLANGDSGRL
jgi:tetratricopeptide (TPR) repeat protein